MGQAYSQNVLNDSVNLFTSTFNSSSATCQSSATNYENINISNNYNSQISLAGFNWSQAINFDVNCYNDSSVTTQTCSNLQQAVQQAAEAVASGLGINSTDSNNLQNLMTNVQNETINAFQTSCVNNILNAQNVTVSDNNGSQIAVFGTNWSQTLDSVVQCINSAIANTTNSTTLTQSLSQIAQAKSIGWSAFGVFMVLLAIIIILGIGSFLLGGGGEAMAAESAAPAAATAAAPAAPAAPATSSGDGGFHVPKGIWILLGVLAVVALGVYLYSEFGKSTPSIPQTPVPPPSCMCGPTNSCPVSSSGSGSGSS